MFSWRPATKKLPILIITLFICVLLLVVGERTKSVGGPSVLPTVFIVKYLDPIVNESTCCTNLQDYVGPLHDVIKALTNIHINQTQETVMRANTDVGAGGAWKPNGCVAKNRIAVIIPYRDREIHLYKVLTLLFQVLKRQQLDFRIIVTEQNGTGVFNKGRIMNAAFMYAKTLKVDCVIFHDVDVLPQDDRIPYDCPKQPLHLGGRVDTLNYEIWYNYMTGGVLSIKMEHFEMANGYSNEYWGWGGEDDDLGLRIKSANLSINRPDEVIGKYTMFKHVKRHRQSNKLVLTLIAESHTRYRTDGLCCGNPKWTVLKTEIKPLFHHLLIDVGEMNAAWKAAFGNSTLTGL